MTVSEISTLRVNQKVNIAATITMGTKDPKQVMLKATQENSLVKENCVVEDATGSIMAHIWSPLIDQLEDGKSLSFQKLDNKELSGMYIC